MAGPSSRAGKRAAHVHSFCGVYSTSLYLPRLQLSSHGVPLCVCTCCSLVLCCPRSACLAESVAGWLEGFARVLDPPRPASLVCAAGEVCGRVAGCPRQLHAATSCNHSISKRCLHLPLLVRWLPGLCFLGGGELPALALARPPIAWRKQQAAQAAAAGAACCPKQQRQWEQWRVRVRRALAQHSRQLARPAIGTSISAQVQRQRAGSSSGGDGLA